MIGKEEQEESSGRSCEVLIVMQGPDCESTPVRNMFCRLKIPNPFSGTGLGSKEDTNQHSS
jgi:hypothetical protein